MSVLPRARLLPSFVLFCAMALGCEGPVAPRVARVEAAADTLRLVHGDTARLAVSAYDRAGAALPTSAVRWRVRRIWPDTVLSIDGATGVIRSVRDGFAWVIAEAGEGRDSAFVIVDARAKAIGWKLDVTEAAPGAQFDVSAVVSVEVGNGTALPEPRWLLRGAPYPRNGQWITADSSVADWTLVDDVMRLRFKRPGTTTVSVAFGGKMVGRTISVRDPGPVRWVTRSCGLSETSELWCRGSNDYGELGTLTSHYQTRGVTRYEQGSSVPVHGALGLRFSMLVEGSYGSTTCGIGADDQRAYCWGSNMIGQLAGPSDNERCYRTSQSGELWCSFVPLAVDRQLPQRLRFVSIAAQTYRFCGHARTPLGGEEVWCWGGQSRSLSPPERRPGLFQ